MKKIILLVLFCSTVIFADQKIVVEPHEYHFACLTKSDIVKNTFEAFLIRSKLSRNPHDKKLLQWYHEFNQRKVGLMLEYSKKPTVFKIIHKELLRSPFKKSIFIPVYTIRLLKYKGKDFSSDKTKLYIADIDGSLQKRLKK